ncbi:MAG: thioredoxin family protein [Chloroflexi bacterium]|nr:thioredoxin family protein [Chloroflexota bacterium]
MTSTVKVEILGWGCPRCRRLEALVREVVAEHAVPAEVVKVTDIARITSLGLFGLPGLVIDGQLVASGDLPKKDRLARWIVQAARWGDEQRS